MILLTGATGLIGRALLPRLVGPGGPGEPVRCLVRDPRRLGAERVRVQIALGDLADPPSFRNALRGVRTVIHLAATIRDQTAGSIEELNGIATWRLVQAAERAGVERFVFFSALNARSHDRTRFLRAKALAERAVVGSAIPGHTVFAPSIVYAPHDRFLSMLERMALLPVMPVSGRGQARFQPIFTEDVADCVIAALAREPEKARYELAGPEVLTHDDIVRLALEAAGRPRPLVHVPTPLVSRGLRAAEALLKSRAPAVWDEAELMEVSLLSERGTADAESLGVTPARMADVLGVSLTAA
jgi:NADH dehydrogenase